MPELIVVPRSDSFFAFWPELAGAADAELRLTETLEDAGPGATPLAVVLNVAGAEEEAEPMLRSAAALGVPAPLVVGARADHRLAVALIRAGAGDYFALPGDLHLLRAEIADRTARRAARAAGVRHAAAQRSTFDFGRIIGESPSLRTALDRAARVIPHGNATVLITGETGTGKELLAQAIHYNSPRAAAPLVEVNCAAIPANLLESEMFGHERGAFTDARAAKPGLFEAAEGGTLFLDEIGDLPLELQGKLLKAIEEKRIRRVGAVRARDIDVRIIAATHRDLGDAVHEGGFREDLYYRLSVIPIHLPALRDRGGDVLLLAEHFLRTIAEQYDLPPRSLTPPLRASLMAHHWPGNIRELRNSLERAVLLGDEALDPRDLSPNGGRAGATADSPLPFPASLAEIERAAVHVMLQRVGGNKAAAANALGISRSRLYRLMDTEAVAE